MDRQTDGRMAGWMDSCSVDGRIYPEGPAVETISARSLRLTQIETRYMAAPVSQVSATSAATQPPALQLSAYTNLPLLSSHLRWLRLPPHCLCWLYACNYNRDNGKNKQGSRGEQVPPSLCGLVMENIPIATHWQLLSLLGLVFTLKSWEIFFTELWQTFLHDPKLSSNRELVL